MSRRLLPRITPLPRRRRSSPSPHITAALAASLARVLASRATDPAWPRSLAALLPPPLTDARLAAAVSALADPDLALALLSWSSSSQPHHRGQHHHDNAPAPTPTPTPTPLAHSALLRLLARAGRFDAAEATLRSMSPAATPTRACLGELAASYADAGMDRKAAEMCARARELHGALPDPRHCNRLLRLLVERRLWVDARKLYGEMLDEEGGADNYSTCVMVRGLCLEGRVQDGRKLIEARWGVGCIPHVVFYNVLIDGYCRRGDIGSALLLLGDMDTKGFLPTVVTYGAVINWLGRKGDMEKIGSLLGEMRVRGLSPNVQIYNTVIDALCKWQSASQAMAVLKIMFAGGCDPDVVTFNTLISVFCQEGDVRRALQLLRAAIRRDLEPNQCSYTPLIHRFCIRGEVMVASDLLVEMMGRGHTPDVVTFGALIHGLVVVGRISEALIVREKMADRQVMPDATIYNVLLSGLCKKRMLPAAKNLLAEMLEQNVQPDKFVYTTLIDGFIRSENLSDARKVFEFMEEKGVCPDVVGYNAMIKGCCIQRFSVRRSAFAAPLALRAAGCRADAWCCWLQVLVSAWCLLPLAGRSWESPAASLREGEAARAKPAGSKGTAAAGWPVPSAAPGAPSLLCTKSNPPLRLTPESRDPRSCILHATVAWIISWRRVWYSGAGDNATPPGASAQLSKFFWPVRGHISSIIGQALERGRSSGSVELELERLHVNLSPFVVNRVLRGVSDSETAVRFYWWAESRPGFDHTQFAIAYIVSLLFIDGNFSLLSEFLDRVRSQGVALHRSLYRILISGYVRAGKFGSVIRTFDEMVTSGCREFGVDYNRLIGVLVKNCCFDLVEKYYGMALDKGFCLTQQNRLHDALQMLEKMGMKGTDPDVVTYTTVVDCLCDNKQFAEAVELWEDMVKRGLKPDTIACGVLIFGLCKNDRVNEAFELALRMLSLDLELSVCIYNALISGFWRSGSIGMVKDAEDLMKKMEMSGVNPDRYSYNQMLKGLCKAHQLDKAFAFVADHMEVGGFCDIVSCNILIDAFCKARKVNSALKLFKEMGYKGIQPDVVTYGTLINGLYSIGYHNLAEETFELMLKAQIVPNVNLYNIMLHNLCKVGHLKQAQNIFFQMIQMEVSPDIITFNTLIYWLGKSSRAIEALDLFRDMRGRGVEPDSLTFRYLISGLLEEGKATLSYEVWEYMMENGIILDRDVSDRLINMLKSKNK
nr:unnamed protein product [Digitaria exilis]